MAEAFVDELAVEGDDDIPELNLGELDLTSQDYILDEVPEHIEENLEDELVQEALRKGVDLRQYSRQIEADLLGVENQSIEDYIKESRHIAKLHRQIQSCDTILERMEQMLSTFQEDLGSISTEIQTLQEQSWSMNIKLKNRQSVKGELSQFVDDIVVTDGMVKHILDTPPLEQQFVEQLHELDHKLNFAKLQSFRDTAAIADVKDVLERLRIKAVSKVRDSLMTLVAQFRKPLKDYQVIQHNMLKFRYFYEFLSAHHRQIAAEVQTEYIDTMSKVLYSYFKAYQSRLMKLQYEVVADRDDLMATEDTVKRGFFSASRVPLKNRSTVFTLGDRACVLTTELEDPIIVPHAAAKSEKKFSFESLFRSLNYALLDNACREYLFIVDFFTVNGDDALALFNAIFGRTLQILQKNMENYAHSCYDAIGVFLCIHISDRFRDVMHRRNVPALDRYFEKVDSLLWPQFNHIVELNIASVRECDPQKLGSVDIMPHYITRRYAEFSAAIVGVNEANPDERVKRSLASLQSEVENFILRLAAEFPGRKEQLIFLINNYDMMLAVLTERTTDAKETESFQQLLTARTQEFVEEILAPGFGGMIGFVKDADVRLERKRPLQADERHMEQLVRGFSADWKRGIESIDQEVMRSFSNFKNGTAILQRALMQLIQYYHRFTKLFSHPPLKAMAVRSELINIHHIMVEVKKHKTTF
ncbi:vacuolar protein sorting-associated protein 52 homolog [Oscarella lobularis]|uniref:vacuolar protein sorting-associated protein 52 homolog n=1 Tax=Oscarella lobularis TaxID=121494 RepID=UPI003313B8B8